MIRKKKKKVLTAGQLAFDKFLDSKNFPSISIGVPPPPMTAEEALEILRLHFAEDYITIWPCSGEQFNCELVYHILTEYKGETK